MLKAKELRIGNWVYFNASAKCEVRMLPIQITANHFSSVEKLFKDDSDIGYEPILITPEILELCDGFQRHGDWWIFKKFPHAINISFINDKQTIGMNEEYDVTINHLHKLQNIVFILTEEELNVNLNVEANSRRR